MLVRSLAVVVLGGALIGACGNKKGDEPAPDDIAKKPTGTDDPKPTPDSPPPPDRLPASYRGHYELAASLAAVPTSAAYYVLISADRIGTAASPQPGVKTPLGGGLPGKPVAAEDLARQLAAYERGQELIGNEESTAPPRPRKRKLDTSVPADEAEPVEVLAEDPDYDPNEPAEGGTGTPMALDEGKMGKKESSPETGRYEMAEVAGDVADGYWGPGGRDIGILAPGTIRGDAPIVLADRALPAVRVVEVMRKLCSHGARVGVARDGADEAAEHPVGIGTLHRDTCYNDPYAYGGGTIGITGAQSDTIVLQLGDDGIYRLDGGGRARVAELGGAGTSALTDNLRQARAGVAGISYLWIAVDPSPSMADLVRVLDAAHAAGFASAFLATMDGWREHRAASAP